MLKLGHQCYSLVTEITSQQSRKYYVVEFEEGLDKFLV